MCTILEGLLTCLACIDLDMIDMLASHESLHVLHASLASEKGKFDMLVGHIVLNVWLAFENGVL